MCGWNEPEKVNVQSVEVKVDAALIEQLRAGYAQLASKGAPLALEGGCHHGTPPPDRGPLNMSEPGLAVFHILPISAFQRPRYFAISELEELAKDMRPLRSYGGWSQEISLDGFSKCSFKRVGREAKLLSGFPECVR
jgi:hypothetical protein